MATEDWTTAGTTEKPSLHWCRGNRKWELRDTHENKKPERNHVDNFEKAEWKIAASLSKNGHEHETPDMSLRHP